MEAVQQEGTQNLLIDDRILCWTKVNCSEEIWIWMHSSTLYKNHVITFGGEDGIEVLNQTTVFDFKTFECYRPEIIGNSPQGVSQHSACYWKDNQVIIYGGYNKEKECSNTVWIMKIYEKEDQTLAIAFVEQQTKGKDVYRYGHTAKIYKDKMYVFGGSDHDYACTKELMSLDLNSFTWEECDTHGDSPVVREHHCTAIVSKNLYIFGGRSTSNLLNDFWKLDLETLNWSKIEPNGTLPPSVEGSTLEYQEKTNCLYLVAGWREDSETFNESFLYDIDQNFWLRIPEKNGMVDSRGSHSSVIFKDKILTWGGRSKDELHTHHQIYPITLLSTYPKKPITNIRKITNEAFKTSLPFCQGDTRFADVIFRVENQTFYAHKIIVAANSSYFDSLFQELKSESSPERIQIPDVQASVFQEFLEYVYGQQVQLSPDLASNLLDLSKKWLIPDLQLKCERYLARNQLHKENHKEVAEKYSLIVNKDDKLKG